MSWAYICFKYDAFSIDEYYLDVTNNWVVGVYDLPIRQREGRYIVINHVQHETYIRGSNGVARYWKMATTISDVFFFYVINTIFLSNKVSVENII